MARTTTLAKVSSQVATQQPQQPLSTAVRGIVSKVLTGKKADDFVTSVVSLVNQNPDLALCDRTSLAASALQAQSLNLSLNKSLGQAWIVPFDDKKHGRKMATFQIGYKGYIQLAIRSGQYRKLNVISIKEGELKFFDPLNEELDVELIQDEVERANTPTIGYYAMFEYLNGFRKAMYWSREKMEAHAKKYSPAFAYDVNKGTHYSFWSKDFDAMASKTMLRQIISKWGIMSTDIIQALDVDMKMARDVNDFSDIVASESLDAPDGVIEMEADAQEPRQAEAQVDAQPEQNAEKRARTGNDRPPRAAPQRQPAQKPMKQETLATPQAQLQEDEEDAAFYAQSAQRENQAPAGDIECPDPNADGSPRYVTDAICMKCPKLKGCPNWEE